MGEWCLATNGALDLLGEGQGAGFGSEGWSRVWVSFGYEELIWDLRMGDL